jgi:hypothetical protein
MQILLIISIFEKTSKKIEELTQIHSYHSNFTINMYTKTLRNYIDRPIFNYGVIFIFVYLLSNEFLVSSVLFGCSITIFTMYIYNVSSLSPTLFARVGEQLLLYFLISYVVVLYKDTLISIVYNISISLYCAVVTLLIITMIDKIIGIY